jgi:ureidoacrylate peracid hydrolase
MHKIDIPQSVIDRVVARAGRLHVYEQLNAAKTALVVVDMQNYFMMEGQQACCPTAREIVPNVNRLAAQLREAGGHVAWVQNRAPKESLQSWANLHAMYAPAKRERRIAELTEGALGFQLWAELDVQSADLKVTKDRYSAFISGSSELEARLQERGVDTVLVVGVATNVCCESTARDAMMRGFRTIMVADANASFSDAEHNAALANFLLFFGDVQTTDEVIERLSAVQRHEGSVLEYP